MKAWVAIAAICIGVSALLSPGPARAEEVTELWRNPFGRATAVAVDPRDSSCRAAIGESITHVAADGTVTGQELGLGGTSLSVNPNDGSWWLADWTQNTVAHYRSDDVLLWSGSYSLAASVAASPTDDSCWVGTWEGRLIRLSAEGGELWSSDSLGGSSLAVNPSDGSCWVGQGQAVIHVSAAGQVMSSHDAPWGAYNWTVAVDPSDGSCWAGAFSVGTLVHLAATGDPLTSITVEGGVLDLAVDPTDHSCWAVLFTNSSATRRLWHYATDGSVIPSSYVPVAPSCVAVDPTDGSCWVGDWGASRLAHVAAAGTELWSGEGYDTPWALGVSPSDASWWLADKGRGYTAHLSAAGEEVWSNAADGGHVADSLSVNAADGSCWLVDVNAGRVTHLAPDGGEAWSGGILTPPAEPYSWLQSPQLVAAGAPDGSVWLIDLEGSRALHVSENGDTLWTRSLAVSTIAVNTRDGSCWVAGDTQLIHLSAAGEELWSGDLQAIAGHDVSSVLSLSVNARDGSVWAGERGVPGGVVVHLAADGRLLWSGEGFGEPVLVAVNPTDGSCWVGDAYNNQRVVHLSVSGEQLSTHHSWTPCAVSVNPADGSCWVGELESGQVVHLGVNQPAHNFYLTPNTPNPPTVLSGGTTSLSAIAVDTPDHGVASWTWSDGGAGGSFSPSANAAAPVYTAPRNFTGTDVVIPLTVTAVCSGDPPLAASASVTLTVGTEYALQLSRTGLGLVTVNGVTHSLPWTDHFQPGTQVSLVPVASPGWELDHWTGDASGTGTLTLTMDRDYSVGAEFALIPGTAFSFPLDYPQEEFADWTGWASAPGSGWEYGPPVAGGGQPIGDGGAILGVDPSTSHSGGNIIGYVIGGNYQPGMSPQYLTTPPLDFRGRQNVSLHFWRWLAVEDQAFDTAMVEVNTGSGWQRLWINDAGTPPIYSFDTAWTEVEYPLPQADGKANVRVRWQMGGSDAWSSPTEYGGWSLDDISFQCAADRYLLAEFWGPAYQLWEQQSTLHAAGTNGGESTWDGSYGLRLRTDHTPTGAWGVDLLPFTNTGPIAPTDSWACEAQVTAPPLSTMAYTAPVAPWDPGVMDTTVPLEWGVWQEFLGFIAGDHPLEAHVTISRFADVQPYSEGGWTRFYVEELAGAVPEIVRGYGGGIYKPQDPVTRDQLAVYIARAVGLVTGDATGTIFLDVPADWWAAREIEACANAGLIAGYPGYSFRPTEPVTRAGMCKFIANGRAYVDPSFYLPPEVTQAPFPDVPADHWAAQWISACLFAGIVQGYPSGNYQPDEGVNRGQMAVFVWRGFLRDRESVIVLGGPTLSRYAPTVQRYAVGSVSTAQVGETLHASVLLDAMRLLGSAQTVRFDLSRIVPEDMLSPAGSFTTALDGAHAVAAHQAAIETGNPYLPITTPIVTTDLEPGEYLMVTSLNDVEVARQVHITLTAPTP